MHTHVSINGLAKILSSKQNTNIKKVYRQQKSKKRFGKKNKKKERKRFWKD